MDFYFVLGYFLVLSSQKLCPQNMYTEYAYEVSNVTSVVAQLRLQA
jgi:hypothetical protein